MPASLESIALTSVRAVSERLRPLRTSAGLSGPLDHTGYADASPLTTQRLLVWLCTTVANTRGYNGLTLVTMGRRLRDCQLAAL